MMIQFTGGAIDGCIKPPSSKSHTHRAIILSALSGGVCTISDPLLSYDTLATVDAVRRMGSVADVSDERITVDGSVLREPGEINVENSGTTMRLLTGICSLFAGETTLTGDESIKKRPMGPLLDALGA